LRSPSQVPVGAEDEDSSSSFRFPLFETFESPRMSVISGQTLTYV
jgi:hypothetical protein